jgi:hypothetical protein
MRGKGSMRDKRGVGSIGGMRKGRRIGRKASFYGIFEGMFEHAFIRFIFLVIAFLAVIFVLRIYMISDFKTEYIEGEMLLYNAFYSPDGFSYVDSAIGRTYPGLIDLEKFTDQTLDNSEFFTNNNHIAARFTLKTPYGSAFKEAYLNKNYFILKYPIAKTNQKGSGSALLVTREINVWAIENPQNVSEKYPAVLVAEVVVGNS